MRERASHRLGLEGLELEGFSAQAGAGRKGVTLIAASTATKAACPVCERCSARVHSRYLRTVSDLPWHGIGVTLEVHSRRFFCDEPSCERRIFCERLPEVAVRARTSNRLEEALLAIAFELGGRAGARLALELGLLVGRDALLKRIRSTSHNATFPEVKVLGVDDFAFRKAHTYGTILVDLERHKVVDLLPDRSSETLADWLRQNPDVQTVSRDRSATYAEGIATGAPQATQVADRWHLVRNLAESLEEFLVTKRPVLKAAARPGGLQMTDNEAATEESLEHTYVDPAAPGPLTPNRPRTGHASKYQIRQRRYRLIVERWQEIRRLQQAGADVADIARKLGTSRTTVYRYKNLPEPPEFSEYRSRGERVLDPYIPYLLKRWEEGCRSGRKLFREIREQGYTHSESAVGRLVAELRRADGLTPGSKKRQATRATQSPGTRHVASLLLRQPEKLTAEQRDYLDRLRSTDETVVTAHDLAQRFVDMVRDLGGERLGEWLEQAESCGALALQKFAASLKKDLRAVRAGLTERWSNGPVEGFVHKLKLVKRQGYGRANFDLLRARVVAS